MNDKIPYKIYLSEDEIPTQWYNVRADMKNKPAPLINPATGKALGLEDLCPENAAFFRGVVNDDNFVFRFC